MEFKCLAGWSISFLRIDELVYVMRKHLLSKASIPLVHLVHFMSSCHYYAICHLESHWNGDLIIWLSFLICFLFLLLINMVSMLDGMHVCPNRKQCTFFLMLKTWHAYCSVQISYLHKDEDLDVILLFVLIGISISVEFA